MSASRHIWREGDGAFICGRCGAYAYGDDFLPLYGCLDDPEPVAATPCDTEPVEQFTTAC